MKKDTTSKMLDSHLREKCGVVGVWTTSKHAAYIARRGLAALQHRGQESAGLSVLTDQGKISTYKAMGLIPHVLTEKVLDALGKSHVAIGHNRYSTSGSSSLPNAQPLQIKHGNFQISIGHNGNIPDVSTIRKNFGKGNMMSDTSLMAHMLVHKRASHTSWEKTFAAVLPAFQGAYSLSVLTNDGCVFGIRDPYGIRPLCLGRINDGWMIASESVSFDLVGGDFVRDVKPGEIVKIDSKGKLSSTFFGEPKASQHCLFEYVYFARPDSLLNGKRVREGREESGRLLAKRMRQKGLKPDVVVPVFDSGYPAAKGAAEELNLKMVDAITTSHYVGRTFIQPGQENRMKAVNGKHNIVADEIIGKKIAVVDDSAVRLTTSAILVHKLKDAGAKEVYMLFASPPIVNQCDLGIDMRSKKDLPAAKYEKKSLEVIEKKMAERIEADALVYLPIEETTKAMGGTPKEFYHTPFGGPHPIRGKQRIFPKRQQKGKPKMSVFISGSGTNLQKIIDATKKEEIDAEIVSVVSNKEDAFGLERAKKYHIPSTVIPYRAKLSDKTARNTYDEKLAAHIKQVKPDLIVLAGWMMVLGNTFLEEMQKMKIAVINLHPALMTETFENEVQTSKGTIPVLRGQLHDVLQKVFDKNLPVSGITIHQVLPAESHDIGPIILKAEVRKEKTDSLEIYEKKIHETEYMLFPTAIKRAIHVLKNNIDISRGDFPW